MRLLKRPAPTLESADRELADRLLAGDRAAFEEFFEGHFPGLYRFALAKVRDPDLARDLVQSAICNAISHLRTYRGEASLAGWLYTICRNEINGHFRKKMRAPEPVEVSETAPEIQHAAEAQPGYLAPPDAALADKEVAHLVHATLDGLPEKYGQALEWKYLDGLPVKEIAERLGLGPKAAESLLTRARQAFRDGFGALSRGFAPPGFGLRGLDPSGTDALDFKTTLGGSRG